MENKMSTVAKLLGVELEEKFMLKNFQHMYKLTEKGLMYWSDISQNCCSDDIDFDDYEDEDDAE